MGSLAKLYSDVISTMELFEQLGLQREHWNAIRRQENRALADELVRRWQQEVKLKEAEPLVVEGVAVQCAQSRETVVSLVSLKLAREILGRDKVISARIASRAWGMEAYYPRCPIRYSEATLCECAEQNAKAGTDWRLVYINGLSLREQRNLRGTDVERPLCFYKDSTWWLDEKQDFWAKTQPNADYYLVDFNGRFARETWVSQGMLIAELGNQYGRCGPHVFGEAIQTIFLACKGERIAESWRHWSAVADFYGFYVIVGGFDADGLLVDSRWRDVRAPALRVSLFRKFEI